MKFIVFLGAFLASSSVSAGGCCEWVKDLDVQKYGIFWDNAERVLIHVTKNSGAIEFAEPVNGTTALPCTSVDEDGATVFYYPHYSNNDLSKNIVSQITTAYATGNKVDLFVRKAGSCLSAQGQGARIEGVYVHK